ncbi:L,D-transpeptidase-like protein [Paucimonas lemoignei]|uniref:L,D-transpeptidase-like protein n=1 Tax=Paucimonas lemoignei TaxID=29443 RepID=A0A4R3HNN9_PAULE|nr:L,D-transpeptidase family protein [Paucimonas lemoignei]TCS31963.1 L,D-transpeptidase-like protein [Paucimonas lemoignei]
MAWAQSKVELVRVLKAERKLQVIAGGSVVKEFKIALGSNPIGHKQQEGDGKTPEGSYTLDYKKSDSAYYKAIHVSYPNEADVSSAKARGVNPGGQIMIHGQKNGLGWLSFISQRMDWTLGCVALSNDDMETVWKMVDVGTKIEIRP